MKTAISRAALLMGLALGLLGFMGVSPALAAGAGLTVSNGGHGVGSGAIVQGSVQINAKPSPDSGYSIQSTEIDIKFPNGTVCVARGTTQAAYTWDSTSYPASACGSSSLNGKTLNQSVTIIASAVEKSLLDSKTLSASISVSLNNTPTPPAWSSNSDPTVSGAAQRQPIVTLKWNASPEPDIKEYRFLRTDPSGTTKQYPVQASSPSAQGCSFDGTTYTCYDTDFPSTGFGGSYSYTLVAYRSSPSNADTCYFGGSCIGAQSTDVRTVSLAEPSPSPTPTNGGGGGGGGTTGGTTGGGTTGTSNGGSGSLVTPSGVPTGTPSVPTSTRDIPQQQPRTSVLGESQFNPGDCFTCGTYKETLPYGQLPGDQGGTLLPGGSKQHPVLAAGSGLDGGTSGPDPRQLWVSIAAGLVLLLTAGHVARVLRTTAH